MVSRCHAGPLQTPDRHRTGQGHLARPAHLGRHPCRWPWTPTSHHGIWGGEDIKAHLANFVDTAGDSLLFTPARGGCHVNDRVFAKDVFKSALTAISRDDMRVHDLRHFAVRLTPARPLPRLACGEDDEVDGGAVETLPHAEEADRVRTHYHFPGTALIH